MKKGTPSKKEPRSEVTAASIHASSSSEPEKEENLANKGVQCFRCKGWGHRMQDCPSRRTLAIDDQAIEQDDSLPIFDEDPSEKGIAIHAI